MNFQSNSRRQATDAIIRYYHIVNKKIVDNGQMFTHQNTN